MLFKHFKESLLATGYNAESALRKWKIISIICKCKTSRWRFQSTMGKDFSIQGKSIPKLVYYCIAQLLMCLLDCNSTVERAFSLLTLSPSDRKLPLSHKTIQDMFTINIIDRSWSPAEKEGVIKNAAESYRDVLTTS